MGNLVYSLAGQGVDQLGQFQANEASATMADRNAQIARRKAVDAIVRGNFMAGRAMSEGGRNVASFRAQASASGFDVQSEANVSAVETIRGAAAQDAEMIKTNALREALGFEAQAQSFELEARMAKRRSQINETLLAGPFAGMRNGLFKVGKG